jgi:hypothetical protein
MIERNRIAKTPREHFMQAAEDELAKFVRKEIAFQQNDRDERAMKLGLPISVRDWVSDHSRTQGGPSVENACCHLCHRLPRSHCTGLCVPDCSSKDNLGVVTLVCSLHRFQDDTGYQSGPIGDLRI